jgi:uncharacterized protein
MTELTAMAELSASLAAPLSFRPIADRVLVTNEGGAHLLLSAQDFELLATGKLESASPTYGALAQRGFIASAIDRHAQAEAQAARRPFLDFGPNLHIVVLTLRCNETCAYCHASRAPADASHTDMSRETADRVLALIFGTTSPDITIEFQGGEPLLHFELLKHMVTRAKEINVEAGKRLQFAMVSNLAPLDDEKLAFLLEHRVQICTSIDGPQPLHDKQRVLPGASAFEAAAQWIKRINEGYAAQGLDPLLYHVEALLTTTRPSLPQARAIVDAYVELGCHAMFLRPLDPFGLAARSSAALAVEPREFLRFYSEAVDYMLELNRRGVQVLERYASIFLTKILKGTDPNYLDIRSPCGAGIGQLAYNYDGRIFTCDEGRMLAEMGDDTFALGEAATSSYRQLVSHDTVCSMVMASNIDVSPDCVSCVYRPYCGLCPAYNYATQGTLHGRMRDNKLCAVYKGIMDYLFGKLAQGESETTEILTRWTTSRERSHFVHCGQCGAEGV